MRTPDEICANIARARADVEYIESQLKVTDHEETPATFLFYHKQRARALGQIAAYQWILGEDIDS